MELEDLKKHLRVDHDFEDELIKQYQVWAEEEIKDSVSTAPNRDDDYFEDNPHFERAVVLLTSHYFENRLPMTEVNLQTIPFAITSAVQKLRGGYIEGQ